MKLSLRALWRGAALIALMLLFLTPVLLRALLFGQDLHFALRVRQRFVWAAVRLLGLRIRLQGKPPEGGPYLFVGNHRSYLDPVVALAHIRALPVAKAEMASWPVIGFAARATGILYVKREEKTSRHRTLLAMEDLLGRGFSILLYPEGTTHQEPRTRPFRKGAFSLAARRGFPVVPVAIEYPRKEVAWVGNDTFLPHFLKTFRHPITEVHIAYGPPLQDSDPHTLLSHTRTWIDQWLESFHEMTDPAELSRQKL
ncbi:MAG: 1-acyl-sn-glycerol-3-phosphate acyltransferase [Bacteroidetes bacterium]|nr:MAG: 1-acyl-sn-glycerol-3-phosphate acyltransferase [Bacteroidota bacterium]